MNTLTKRLTTWAVGVGLLLLVPLALTIRDGNVPNVGWNWSGVDFVFAFVLLFGAGAAYELISRKFKSGTYKFAVGLAMLTAVALVWVNAVA